jgi:anti-anti-sigma regulatory factor
MAKEMNQLQLNLSVDDAGARVRFEAAVEALLEQPQHPPRLIVSLAGETLPADVVAMLVAGLRRLREVGGAISVEATTPALRDAMALHGLDRVFALPLDPGASTRAARKGWVPRMAAAGLAALALVSGLVPSRAAAQAPLTTLEPPAILAKVIERNPSLSSYQGRLHIDIRLTSFPWLREHLDATTYYKRPSNYEVVFDKLPSYARGFEKLYTDIGDPANWEKRFVITPAGETEFNHHRDVSLRLVQRVRGMIDHETALIDPATWTIDQIRYDYYNGGSITMSQAFETIGGYSLLISQKAEIAIPHVRAVAYGTYADYQTNVAVDDTVFAKNAN